MRFLTAGLAWYNSFSQITASLVDLGVQIILCAHQHPASCAPASERVRLQTSTNSSKWLFFLWFHIVLLTKNRNIALFMFIYGLRPNFYRSRCVSSTNVLSAIKMMRAVIFCGSIVLRECHRHWTLILTTSPT